MHIQSKEKKFSAKIKLETLLNFLDEATEDAKTKFLSQFHLNEKELEEYLQKKDQIIINADNSSRSSESLSIKEKEKIKKSETSLIQTTAKTEDDNTKFENYDIELLEKEIYDKCDNNQDLFNFDNESLFNTKVDSIINNAFCDNIDSYADMNCMLCNQSINTDKANTSNNSEYMSLMNKLIELEKKVQDTKKELKKFETPNESLNLFN